MEQNLLGEVSGNSKFSTANTAPTCVALVKARNKCGKSLKIWRPACRRWPCRRSRRDVQHRWLRRSDACKDALTRAVPRARPWLGAPSWSTNLAPPRRRCRLKYRGFSAFVSSKPLLQLLKALWLTPYNSLENITPVLLVVAPRRSFAAR